MINTTQSDDFINPTQFMEFKEFREFTLTLSRRRPLYIETSPLIWGTNQWTGFYIITASVKKELKLKNKNLLFLVQKLLEMYEKALTVVKLDIFDAVIKKVAAVNQILVTVKK